MQALLGFVEYVDSPNAPSAILVVAPTACRRGMGGIPADAWDTDGSRWSDPAAWTVVAIQPNASTI